MGVAHYISLENKEPGFDTFVNGKAISKNSDAIAKITKRLKIPSLNDLTSFASAAAALDVPPGSPGTEEKWFEPQEGLQWVRKLAAFIGDNPSSVKAPEMVLSDLEEYEEVLEKADKIESRWHFAIDF